MSLFYSFLRQIKSQCDQLDPTSQLHRFFYLFINSSIHPSNFPFPFRSFFFSLLFILFSHILLTFFNLFFFLFFFHIFFFSFFFFSSPPFPTSSITTMPSFKFFCQSFYTLYTVCHLASLCACVLVFLSICKHVCVCLHVCLCCMHAFIVYIFMTFAVVLLRYMLAVYLRRCNGSCLVVILSLDSLSQLLILLFSCFFRNSFSSVTFCFQRLPNR